MTNTKAIEAIKMIKDAIKFDIPVLDRHCSEALDLAIKALEGQKTGRLVEDGCLTYCENCYEQKRFPHWEFCPCCGRRWR